MGRCIPLLLALLLFPAITRADDLPTTTDIILDFAAEDGTPLNAKLTIPTDTQAPPPVVFFLHGAMPRSYDNPYRYTDDEGTVHNANYLDFHANELAKRGIAFFRMSKRGCIPFPDRFGMRLDRETFATATMTVLLDDYNTALQQLRERDDIDTDRIILLSASEGTRLAPLLALRSPAGIRAIAMIGYAQDNARDLVTWQLTHGPWRGVQHRIPEARDGQLTREQYDAALERDPSIAAEIPFNQLDANRDGILTDEDMANFTAFRRFAILNAVDERNDEFLRRMLMELTSAYLLDWWDAPPNHTNLLKLDIPLAIFHATLDNTTRVEGVHETEAAFREAGRTNLTVRIYPDADHDLNLDWRNARDGGPPGYRDAFDLIAEWAAAP